jgi:hypothetical protein
MHVLSNELEFASTCLDLLNPNDDGDDDCDDDNDNKSHGNSVSNNYVLASTNSLMDSYEGNASGSLSGHEFLHRYILEKSVYGLEKLISIFVSLNSNVKLSSKNNNNNNNRSSSNRSGILEVENSSPLNVDDDQTENDTTNGK